MQLRLPRGLITVMNSSLRGYQQVVCCYADKRSSTAAATAGTQSPAGAAAAAVVAAVRTKAKKVPRYVKEALSEVEQEKLTKLAAEQTQAPAQTNLQSQEKLGKLARQQRSIYRNSSRQQRRAG